MAVDDAPPFASPCQLERVERATGKALVPARGMRNPRKTGAFTTLERVKRVERVQPAMSKGIDGPPQPNLRRSSQRLPRRRNGQSQEANPNETIIEFDGGTAIPSWESFTAPNWENDK